jgi:intein/homing endonuclease
MTEKKEQKIFFHHDADGIVSAYMTSFAYPNAKFVCPDKFGDTKGISKNDIMVDMKPKDSSKEIIVIDHHEGHPSLTERKYKLTFGDKPASILCWEKFKDKIPKEEWWKVLIGATGDMQYELVPYEIWESCPELLTRSSDGFYKFKDWVTYPNPIFIKLSSAINCFLRYGEWEKAMDLIKDAKSPYDIIENPEVKKQKAKLSKDFSDTLKGAKQFNFGYLKVVIYESPKARLTGYIASVVAPDNDFLNPTTVLAINELNGRLSMRGRLTTYYKGRLAELDYLTINGHGCFDKNTEVLTNNGWKYFKDVNLKEDKFYSLNPKNHRVELVKAINEINYKYNGEMLHFKSRANDLLVTPNHNMPVISDWRWRHSNDKTIKFKKADSIAKHDRFPTALGKWIGNDISEIKLNDKTYDAIKLVKLFGWYVSEGWVVKNGNHYNISIAQSESSQHYNELKLLLNDFSPNVHYNKDKKTFNFTENNIGKYLYIDGEKSFNKYVPDIIKTLSPNLINHFLDTYNKGDGYIAVNSKIYVTTSKQLVDDICELIMKCGKRPSVIKHTGVGTPFIIRGKQYFTRHKCWKIRENINKVSTLGCTEINKVDYNDYVYDVELEKNHILFVRRNGKCIWSGNCASGGELKGTYQQLLKDLRRLFPR